MNGYNFTERVRRVLACAREESVRLHHAYIGTEHILLGLLDEDTGVSGTVLQHLGVDPAAVRRALDAAVTPGKPDAHVGPDLPYTSRAKKILEFAMAEARELNHSYVGTEHLLLGVLREEKGIAAQVLMAHGVTMAKARAVTLDLLGQPDNAALRAVPPAGAMGDALSPARFTIEIAYLDGRIVRRSFLTKGEAASYLAELG